MEIGKNWMSVGLLALLIAVTMMQAFQLNDLAKKAGGVESSLSSMKASVASAKMAPAAAAPAPAPTKKPTVPSSIANLPNMVGGC